MLTPLKTTARVTIAPAAGFQLYILVRCVVHGDRTLVPGKTPPMAAEPFCKHCCISVAVDRGTAPQPKRASRRKAIRKFCFSCAWRPGKNKKQGVADCTSTVCPLWPFRLGKRPEKEVRT